MEGAQSVKNEVVFSEEKEYVCLCVCMHLFPRGRIFKWSISVLQNNLNVFYVNVNFWA